MSPIAVGLSLPLCFHMSWLSQGMVFVLQLTLLITPSPLNVAEKLSHLMETDLEKIVSQKG